MHRPPSWFQTLLSWFVSDELLEEILGDLNETYHDHRERNGKLLANLYCLIEVIHFSRTYNNGRKYQSSNTLSMIQNYIKVALRNLLSNRLTSFINISGLGVGLACVMVIFMYLTVETSYDKFHMDGKDIYRVQHIYGFINAPTAPVYEREYADVVASLRINPFTRDRRIRVSESEIYTEDILMAEDNFFTFFSFPLVSGDPEQCLADKYSLVISETMAHKFYGNVSPIGKTVDVEDPGGNVTTLTVTGVFKDVPYHSHLQFDLIMPFELAKDDPQMAGMLKSWPNDWIGTYLKLEKDADHEVLEAEYADIWRKYVDPSDTVEIDFMPLEDLYLESSNLANDYALHGDKDQVRMIMAIAIVVLLIACINFINLSTAGAYRRSKEVGLRKTLGAYRKQLIRQFLVESALLTFISFLVAIGLVIISIPYINHFADINLYNALSQLKVIAPAIGGIFLLTTLGTSIYPALVLSSFKPARALKPGNHNQSSSGLLRRGLVVGQFAISVILIISALIIYDQMNFIKGKELGFDVNSVVKFQFGSTTQLQSKWTNIKSQLEQQPGVQLVANTRHLPGDNAYYWNYKFDGVEHDDPHGDGWRGFYLGENMIEAIGLEVILGRSFDATKPMDSAGFVLNESAWNRAINEYGEEWKDPIGKTIEYWTASSGDWAMIKRGPVIGVVKDFHHHSLQRPIDPIIIHLIKSNNIVVKTTGTSAGEVIRFVENQWSEWNAPVAFNYEYLQDTFNAHYSSERRFNVFILVFCMIAIGIACLGLFGLSLFTTQQRIKEIGVRKTLGASVPSLLKMLSLDFLKLVGIAILIAVPVAVYFMNQWLDNFAYSIDLSVWHVAISAVIAICIAQVTISYNTVKAATTNPTKILRSE